MKRYHYRKVQQDELQTLVDIDDKASELYLQADIAFNFSHDHSFVLAERHRWERAIENGLAHCAINSASELVGFAVCGYVNNQPYLDQISVLPEYMQQGIGGNLLRLVFNWSGENPLYLTTYAHLPWNKPYYEKFGFVAVEEANCGQELKAVLNQQRQALPEPEQRIAMVRSPVKTVC